MNTLVHKNLARTYHLIVLPVKLLYTDCTVTIVLGLEIGSFIVVHDVCLTIIIKEDTRVNTSNFRHTNGVAPFAEGVLGLHIEITGTNVGGNHVICLVVGIVTDSRSKDTATDMLPYHIDQLRRTAEHMTHLLPIDKVAAMENGHTREISKSRGYQEIVSFTIGTDTGI